VDELLLQLWRNVNTSQCAPAIQTLGAIRRRYRLVLPDAEGDFVKKEPLENMLRIVHIGAQAAMTVFSSLQNIVWFTDSDAIVANEELEQLFGKLAEAVIRHQFMPDEKIGRIGFGISAVDDDSLEIEDFISVPDLVAGALCETLDQLSQAGLKITLKLVLNKPTIGNKANAICEWIGKTVCPLKKLAVVFDKVGNDQWDFRPTCFAILNPGMTACEVKWNAQKAAAHLSDPIRFDIEEYR
jgi:hypothetical protein